MSVRTLASSELVSPCDPSQLGLEADLAEGAEAGIVGQSRAAKALAFALSMDHPGYHVFVMGPPGTGRRTLVRHAVAAHLSGNHIRRSDWVYVNNFEQPHKPVALELPAGRGTELRAAMQSLVQDLGAMIPSAFESEEYAIEVERINAEFKERGEHVLVEVGQEAERRGLAIARTPVGFTVAPQKNGEVMPPAEFEALSGDKRAELQKAMVEVQEKLVRALRLSMRFRKEHADRIRELNRSMTHVAVDHAIEDLRERFADLPRVSAYLEAVCADVVEHASAFRGGGGGAGEEEGENAQSASGDLARYEVNLILDAAAGESSALVEAELPSHQNLVGRVDHVARFGMLLTDFRLVKGGLLHRANGGFLLIDALELLLQPFAWPMLKRALLAGQIRIESTAELVGMISTVQLEPEPIPLQLKVILFGAREICELLKSHDAEFDELFRVIADVADDVPRQASTQAELARSLRVQSEACKLLPASAEALARTIEHGARMADDSMRITAQVRSLLDLLKEADRLARTRGSERIEPQDVRGALGARRERAARADERLRDAVLREIVMIATEGERIGQVNALSVHEIAGERFGSVMRITATSRLGDGEVVDIQRETRLGGPLHAKGVMILSSFLASRYSRAREHSIRASLVFEQLYGFVEGDSASLAETAALLSSIAEVPIRQCLAVTGSINQFGDVQAIGGVNEKIEGFFDVCAARGLDGRHAVIIPLANVSHLMLREDVVGAVAAGRFAVHAAGTVDDALALLTGMPAGDPAQPGDDTLNGRITRRLLRLSQIGRGLPRGRGKPPMARPGKGGGRGSE